MSKSVTRVKQHFKEEELNLTALKAKPGVKTCRIVSYVIDCNEQIE